MTHASSLRPLACALLLACAPAMAADAPALLSANASADGMGFRLIDLDPDDGIDPYWLFVKPFAKTYISYGETGNFVREEVDGTFFDTPSFSAQNATGTASVVRTNDTMAGHSAVTTSDLSKLSGTGWLPVGAPEGTTVFGSSTSMTDDFHATAESFKERTWVLSPRTAVVFEGTAHLDARSDLAQLAGTQQTGRVESHVDASIRVLLDPVYEFKGLPANMIGLEGDEVLTAAQIMQHPDLEDVQSMLGSCCLFGGDPSQVPPSVLIDKSFRTRQVWTNGELDSAASRQTLDLPFSFRVDNTGDAELVGTLLARLDTSTYLIANPTSVPEPGTGIAMALGLAGLAWVARRQAS